MPRQQEQFEEFQDGPQPINAYLGDYPGQPSPGSYQSGYTGPQPMPYPPNIAPPTSSYINVLPGQRLLVQDLGGKRASGNAGRLFLALFSLMFIFAMFIVTLAIAGSNGYNQYPVTALAVFFSLVFAAITLAINVIYNRKH